MKKIRFEGGIKGDFREKRVKIVNFLPDQDF